MPIWYVYAVDPYMLSSCSGGGRGRGLGSKVHWYMLMVCMTMWYMCIMYMVCMPIWYMPILYMPICYMSNCYGGGGGREGGRGQKFIYVTIYSYDSSFVTINSRDSYIRGGCSRGL